MFHKVLRKRVLSVSFSLLLSVFVCCGQSVQKSIKLKSGRPLFSQISEKAKIYEVEDDFDLGGKTIKLPSGTQFIFNGGKIKNGVIETDCLLLSEWNLENVKVKGNVDFTTPISVPVDKAKEFITTILEYKPANSDLPTVFMFSSNQVYNWDGELNINKKNVTMTGGGTIAGHIHIGLDGATFKQLKYDAYSATSHSNIIISNLRFTKYHTIGTSEESDKILKYIQTAKPVSENIAISLVNSCHIKIEGCFFDNVPYPIVYTANKTYVNQNVRRLNIVNCDFELCHTAVYAPSLINNSLEYGDLVFSNNNVHPTFRGLDVSCIDGLKVYNNIFSTCARSEFGSNIYAFLPGQVVITNNSFYGEYNGEAVVLDSPGTCLIDGNLFSSQGTNYAPSLKNGIACLRIIKSSKTHYTAGLSITNNLFTNVNRLPIYADGYFRGANIQGNLLSGNKYTTNKGILYYFHSTFGDESHLQQMRMTDNIMEDMSGTLELRMDFITDLWNGNSLYPETVLKKNMKTYLLIKENDFVPVIISDFERVKPIYVVSPIKSSYVGNVTFVFNGACYSFKVNNHTSDEQICNEIIKVLKQDFGDSHTFKIIDNNLWIVGKSADVPVITPMWEINEKTAPYRFRVVYQNLGYRITVKDVDGKNFIDTPLYNYGIDPDDDGKIVRFGPYVTVLKTGSLCRKSQLDFRDRPAKKNSYKWIYNDMFFACGNGGSMSTNKILAEIVSLCYSDRASVRGNSLILNEVDKEYGFSTCGNTWYSTYTNHVADYHFLTESGIEYNPDANSFNNVGKSTERPNNPNVGFQFYDVTIGRLIIWDGSFWVDTEGGKR